MVISHINNPTLRRVTLAVCIVPVVLVAFFVGMWDVVSEIAHELPRGILVAWRGDE